MAQTINSENVIMTLFFIVALFSCCVSQYNCNWNESKNAWQEVNILQRTLSPNNQPSHPSPEKYLSIGESQSIKIHFKRGVLPDSFLAHIIIDWLLQMWIGLLAMLLEMSLWWVTDATFQLIFCQGLNVLVRALYTIYMSRCQESGFLLTFHFQ